MQSDLEIGIAEPCHSHSNPVSGFPFFFDIVRGPVWLRWTLRSLGKAVHQMGHTVESDAGPVKGG